LQVFLVNKTGNPDSLLVKNNLVNLHNKSEINIILLRLDSITDVTIAKTVVEFVLKHDDIKLVTVISSNNKMENWSIQSKSEWGKIISLSDYTYKSPNNDWGIKKSDCVMEILDNKVEIIGGE